MAAYGTESSGGFGFVDHIVGTPISEVSLYSGATICGWVSLCLSLHPKFLIEVLLSSLQQLQTIGTPRS